MLPADLAAVGALEVAIFPDPWDTEGLEPLLRDPVVLAQVAVSGAKIVGYTFAWMLEGQLEVINLAVADAYRKRGVGAQLLKSLLALGREAGCPEAFLDVRRSNHAAICLYEKFGFVSIGVRRRYYRDGEDALVMRISALPIAE